MSIMCNIDLDMLKSYSCYKANVKIGAKKHKVYFRLDCRNEDELKECVKEANSRDDVVFIKYDDIVNKPILSDVPIIKAVKVAELSEDEIREVSMAMPAGITAVIKLQDDYNNLKFIADMSKKYKNVRYVGGNLFRIKMTNIGNYSKELLDKKGIKYNDYSHLTTVSEDILALYDINDLDLEFTEYSRKEVKIVTKTTKVNTKGKKYSNLGIVLGDF